MAAVCVSGFGISSFFVNCVGKKVILVTQGFCAGLVTIFLYFSKTTMTTLILSSISVAQTTVAMAVVLAVVVDLFPTSLRYTLIKIFNRFINHLTVIRTLAIAITLIVARSGAIVGNLLFPIVLTSGCLQTFLIFGSLIMGLLEKNDNFFPINQFLFF